MPDGGASTVRLTVVCSEFAASDTVIVCAPPPTSVTENVPWPAASVVSAGSCTPVDESLVLKWTVPLYDVTGTPCAFSAVTVTVKLVLVLTVVGAVTLRSCTTGAPTRNALKRLSVVFWMRVSARAYQNPSSARLHEIVPEEKTHAPLGAW